jgi:hypothetical protein
VTRSEDPFEDNETIEPALSKTIVTSRRAAVCPHGTHLNDDGQKMVNATDCDSDVFLIAYQVKVG